MDAENLKTLADAKFKHALFRKNLRERIESQLSVAHGGGLFKASPELISFLHCWTDAELVIEDLYNNPIKCNRVQLLTALKEAYQFALNAWNIDFENSKKIRNGKQL
jgi:hypothetical protein